MKNVQYSTLFRPQKSNSREYHLNTYQGKFFPLESVSLIQKHKSYEIFSHGHVDQSLLLLRTKFLGLGEITGRIFGYHIFVNEQSFKFRYKY